MVFHKVLAAALVVVPMALTPADAAAQQRGSDRAQTARNEAPAVDRANDAAPKGLQKAFEGRTPPAAIQRLFPALFPPPAPEVVPEPEPAPEPEPVPVEECDTSFAMVDGAFVMVDCNGNVVGAQ